MNAIVLFRIGNYNINYKHFLTVCSFIYLVCAWFSVGHYHADEHYQVFEFANFKLGHIRADKLPWDFREQVRSAILPGIVYVIYKVLDTFTTANPFFLAFLVRLLAATLSIVATHLLIKIYLPKIKTPLFQKWMIIMAYLLWFVVFISVRFSAESISASLFIIAFALAIKETTRESISYFISGIFFGLSFSIRYQLVFMLLGFGLWILIYRRSFIRIFYLITGALLAIGIGILIDKWFYGDWVLSFWNHYNANILEGVAAEFNRSPFWYYLNISFLEGIPPFSLVYILSVIVFIVVKKKHEISWVLVPHLLVHCFIANKQIRLMFPVLPFIPFIMVYALEIVQQKWVHKLTENKVFLVSVRLFVMMNALALVMVILRPADDLVKMLKVIYTEYPAKTTLYFIDDHPYVNYPQGEIPPDTLSISFYKRENLECTRIDSLQDIPATSNNNMLYVGKKWMEPDQIPERFTPVFSRFPNWIKHLNFNNWMSRTNFWQAYQIENVTEPN